MDIKLFIYTFYELCLSLVFGLLSLFLILRITTRFLLKEELDDIQNNNNIAAGILIGSMIISSLLLIQTSILPAVDVIRLFSAGSEPLRISYFLFSFLYFLAFYVFSFGFSMLILILTVRIYTIATRKIEEMAQIRSGNIAVAVLVAAVILGMALFVRSPLSNMLRSCIRYDSIEYHDPGLIGFDGE